MRYSIVFSALLLSHLASAETNSPLVHPARGLVGIKVEQATNGVRVAQVGLGTPAQRAGLRAGDLITRIDGRPTQALSIAQACSLMGGTTGSIVNVEFLSYAERTVKAVQMRREYINFEQVGLISRVDVEVAPPAASLFPTWIEALQNRYFERCYVEKKPVGTPCEWVPMRLALTNGYAARVGPVFYRDEANDDADYYSIDVEWEKGPCKGSVVMFTIDMPLSWVSPEKLTGTVDRIVRFERDTQTVTFDLGSTNFTYRLENPPLGEGEKEDAKEELR